MAEIGGQTLPGGRQVLDGLKGTLGEGQPPREVRVSRERRCKPVAEPPDFLLGREVLVVQPDTC